MMNFRTIYSGWALKGWAKNYWAILNPMNILNNSIDFSHFIFLLILLFDRINRMQSLENSNTQLFYFNPFLHFQLIRFFFVKTTMMLICSIHIKNSEVSKRNGGWKITCSKWAPKCNVLRITTLTYDSLPVWTFKG